MVSAATRKSMQGNRRRDTKPELALRAALREIGLTGYRVDFRVGRARPDVCWPGRRVAVFVNGCFWHACPKHGSRPKENSEYWIRKLVGNQRRDRAQNRYLRQRGWIVISVWEHESPELAAARIARLISAVPTGGRRRKSCRPGAAVAEEKADIRQSARRL